MFLEPVLKILSKRWTGLLNGFFSVPELLRIAFGVATLDCSSETSFSFGLGLITGFVNIADGEGPDPPTLRSHLTRDLAIVCFVLLDGDADGFGCCVLDGESSFGNLDPLPVCVPATKKNVAPAYAALPLPFENASCHWRPTARVMTVTSVRPRDATSLARSPA